MEIDGAKFQEHCFNISRDIVYSVFTTFQLEHHWSNLHNRKTSLSRKRKKDISKRKTPFLCILKGLSNKHKQISVPCTLEDCTFEKHVDIASSAVKTRSDLCWIRRDQRSIIDSAYNYRVKLIGFVELCLMWSCCVSRLLKTPSLWYAHKHCYTRFSSCGYSLNGLITPCSDEQLDWPRNIIINYRSVLFRIL